MEKRLIIAVVASLVVVFILVVVNFLHWSSDDEQFFKGYDKLLEEGNGIVVNIWMDEDRFDVLRKNGIKYLFVDVGDTGANGKLTTPEKNIKSFLEKVEDFEREENYDFVLFPYSEVNTYESDVDSNFEDNFIEDYLKLVDLGFDGVYVDVEPVRDEEDYLEFIGKVRGEFSFVGVYSGAVASSGFSDNEWEWSLDFYEEVCEYVDFIFVPSYDSGLTNEKEYKEYVERQVGELSALDLNCDLMLGIPTHKSGVESLENALEGYGDGGKFIGVAIFAEWTTSEEEWGVFEGWVG